MPRLKLPSNSTPKSRASNLETGVHRVKLSELLKFRWHEEAHLLLKLGRPPLLLLVGDPGVGKTTFAKHVAVAETGTEPVVLSGSPEIEQSHLFGRWTLAGDETRFVDGPLPLAIKQGRWLLIEEFSQIPLECRAALLPLRDQSEITNPMNGDVLQIPNEFRLIATSNSESLNCRKNRGIAQVLFDGFFILSCGELSDAQVQELLANYYPATDESMRTRAFELWKEYRDFTSNGISGKPFLSYRAVDHLMQLLQAGMNENRAVQIALVNKFLPGDSDLFTAADLKNSFSE